MVPNFANTKQLTFMGSALNKIQTFLTNAHLNPRCLMIRYKKRDAATFFGLMNHVNYSVRYKMKFAATRYLYHKTT